MPGDREKAFRIGFAGYIEKPVDPEHFAGIGAGNSGGARELMRILSVDDNTHNLYLIERLCLAKGHEVISVHNGLEALERLATAGSFDLIISDILMPEMDGFQLCRL